MNLEKINNIQIEENGNDKFSVYGKFAKAMKLVKNLFDSDERAKKTQDKLKEELDVDSCYDENSKTISIKKENLINVEKAMIIETVDDVNEGFEITFE